MADNSTDNVVNRREFENKLKEYYARNPGSNRSVWDKNQEQIVINALQLLENNDAKKPISLYHYEKKYELMKIGNEVRVILKRLNAIDPLVLMVAQEDYYEKLYEAHVQTGHGGRDKMIYYAKNKWRISKMACNIFVTCCQTCNRKRVAPQRGVIVKPITSDGFNMRGQVDLIDFQSCPDGEYKWLMNYQDHATKFLHLRPLTSKHAVNVADELSKIFFTWGAPYILQSDNGREFVAAVIHELGILSVF